MSLLQPEPTPATILQKQEAFYKSVKALTENAYRNLSAFQQRGINMLWKSSALTPEEAVAALGADAKKIFQLHGILTQALMDMAAVDGTRPQIALPTNAFTLNDDGTVTVLDTPYAP
ncbi:MAG: hypothetical protein E6R03_02240 [Hyphomicrobiaceae bacterium]|nr:MAG: hypothetical protein E6R03_02240 [Hyphomicrobiaceae bacterium]